MAECRTSALISFQTAAVDIYTRALPWEYLLRLAEGFEDCADLMVASIGPSEHGSEWSIMQQYLRSACKAIRDAAPPIEVDTIKATDLAPQTPPVMPFNRLAQIIHPDGVAQLQTAGARIEAACDTTDTSPLTDQETEWLRRMIAGDRVLDIAYASGYSERALYRALSDLWDKLGVDNRNEAIAIAVENNWL